MEYRILALQGALQAIAGLRIMDVTATTDENGIPCMTLSAEIKKAQCIIGLTGHEKTVDSIQITSKEFQWMEPVIPQILADSRGLPAPNDLRYALFVLGALQDARPLFQSHISDFRKKCIVEVLGMFALKMTFRTGLTISVQANLCYSFVPSGVVITEVSHNDSIIDKETLDSFKHAADERCFNTLYDLVAFVEEKQL